ncbi:hypothetical protein BST65_27465 [Bradyrhizobium canariense]|nr:hypothetical protein BST65_27465 [Bradyrhizobium canariense]OSI29468.1 hypothetical protein BST66_26215 [Bradyrhizobium canariense]OSI38902.1 hypothetical protein BSZ20_32930 [Bradyrhizobium canariense]OSI45569.1 hypothetical protein BST67_27265 [Bradyrhizobium canariense]OSI53452.1 hypothetical protein BSZ15_25555 [Bradyrhizobium canariense]
MANAASSTVTAFRWLMGPGHFTAGAEIRNPSMLPGFRFLFAAILLSASILVFGLGAAALLRASHEQYVSNPSWRNGPQEQVFAQAPEPAQPVLAVLRVEPEAATDPTPSLRDQVPTIALPMSEPEQVVALTTETDGQPQVVAPPADVPAEPANAETKAETTTDAAVQASSNTLTPADASASIAEAKPVAIALASKPTPAAPSGASASSRFDMASAKFAALNDPATTAWEGPPAKAKAGSKADSRSPESKATKPRAHRVKKRRRIVRRAPPPVQQLDPFGQPQPTLAATTTARARQ